MPFCSKKMLWLRKFPHMLHCPCTQTVKTTFSCRDDCTLTKHTQRLTYSTLRYFFRSSREVPACPGCKCYYGAVFSLSEEYCNKALYLTPHIHSHDWPILIISTHHTQLSHSYTFQIFTVFRYLQVSYIQYA